ncbi:SufE family protein [Mariniblastus fucicola]|uniref:Cysteine desulfuration protein SufE n=1 Tax=Mariniblastus fucicola TaxID=980251 RepID=A0A5B9PHZ2_9BACT|nr:SufE family protein [Mariniblastus fucicola]QEG25239.1 Cysteine desulfuration protein SufE [Mariniblastus fucicola]
MSEFPPTTDELFETFEDLQEWDERYDFIIDLGRELPTLPAELQTEDNIVKGCMSTVWVVTDVEGEGDSQKLNIQADSDSIIVKGLIVLLLAFYNNMSPAEVAAADVESYLSKLGLNQHLSPQRRNGLFSMVKRLRTLQV